MGEIAPRGGPPKRTITPDTSAPSAPTITAPGAPAVSDPGPSSSRRREAEMRRKFEDIEEQYRHSKYVGHKARRGDYRAKPAPETPVSDAYTLVIRPKDQQQVAREMLDDLVVHEEQRKRDDWLREEEVRAAVLPHQIRAEVQRAAYMDALNQYYNEQNKRRAEQAARDAEAQKYGYATDAELQAAIREEKSTKRANELGLALTEAEKISQTIAREGYLGAAAEYGRDPAALIAEQEARAKAAQTSLEQNFGIEVDSRPTDYFRDAADYAAQVQAAEGREEKAIRRANELGLALTETQLISQTIAREGYAGAAAKYGRDPGGMIAKQTAKARSAQSSLEQSFGIERDPRHDEYLEEAADFAARRMAPIPPPTKEGENPILDGIDQIVRGHAPILAKFKEDTAFFPQQFDEIVSRTGANYDTFAAGMRLGMPFVPEPITRAAWETVRNPARPISALMELPWETAVGTKRLIFDVAPYYAKHPGEIPGAVPRLYEAFTKEYTSDPVGVVTKTGASFVVGGAAIKAGSKVAAPLSSHITEFSIKVRSPAVHRPAVGAISDIGRNVPGLRSTIEVDPDLSRILNIGKAAPQVEEVLAAQPHTIYGSATQIGQMPARRIPAPPKDLDVFVTDPKAFNTEMVARLGPEYSVEGNIIRRRIDTGESPHAIDTHKFPEGYPVESSSTGKIAKVAYQEEKVAPNLPFDFMPQEVLKAGKLTQEYLYTQTLRKASSVMGEPESLFRWKFGPPEHRMKDIPTLIADAEWLVEATRQQMPQMGLIQRATTARKIRKIERGLDVLRGDPLVQEAMGVAPAAMAVDDLPTITVISRPPRSRQSPNILAVPAASASPVVARKSRETAVDAYVDQLTSPSPARSRSPAVRTSPSIFEVPSTGRRSPAPIRPSPTFTITPSTVPSPSRTPVEPLGQITGFPDPSPSLIPSPSPAPSRVPSPSPGITTPTVPSPTIIPGITFTPPPPPRIRRESSDRRNRRASEDYIHYADTAFPVAQLESAYTNLPDPKIRPLKMAKNLFRVTRGPIELLPRRRPVKVATRRVRKPNRKKVPWETPWTIGDLDLF